MLWSGYLDVIHRHIGELRTDVLMILPYSFFATLILFTPIVVNLLLFKLYGHLKRLGDLNEDGGQSERRSIPEIRAWFKRGLYLVTAATVAMTLVTLLDMAEGGYSRRASIWAERSVEIVAPNISAEERLVLRSELRSVQTAVQFYAFYEHLHAIAQRSSVSLPAFSPIGYGKKS
jgi:hypothetical protein